MCVAGSLIVKVQHRKAAGRVDQNLVGDGGKQSISTKARCTRSLLEYARCILSAASATQCGSPKTPVRQVDTHSNRVIGAAQTCAQMRSHVVSMGKRFAESAWDRWAAERFLLRGSLTDVTGT
jgi:hypothetical protein